MRLLICSCLVASIASAQPVDRPKLLVLELGAGVGVQRQLATAITESVIAAAGKAGYFQVVSTQDVQTLLGVERQRQTLGCSQDATACMSELAGALGARYVLSGSLSRVGDAFQLSMQMLDSARGQPIGRALRFARDLDATRAIVPYAVADATGTPPPSPPSKLLPYTMIGGGGAIVLAAAGLGAITFAQGSSTARELQLADSNPTAPLQPAAAYTQQGHQLVTMQIIAWAGAAVGAGLVVGGIWLSAKTDSAVSVALVPTGNGFSLAGVMP